MFQSIPPVAPKSFEQTPFHWVSTPNELQTLLDKLRKAPEVAVDLEHHSYRSFNGFVCLMQISTRDEDFIVDTLCLRGELEELNEVFTDPNIVKVSSHLPGHNGFSFYVQVFHGAESDIVWLQQNFNLYIVNLFDTFHASKVLGKNIFHHLILAFIFCRISPARACDIIRNVLRLHARQEVPVSRLAYSVCTNLLILNPCSQRIQTASTRNALICSLRYPFPVIHLRQPP
jgi:hypothetical protein